MALNATVGDPDADSFLSLTEANTYFAAHWSLTKQAAWEAILANGRREQLLKAACKVIITIRVHDLEVPMQRLPVALVDDYWPTSDQLVTSYDSEQALPFPRNVDIDSAGDPFVPQAVKDAQCEQAIYMISMDESGIAASLTGIIEEAVGAGGVRSYVKYSGHSTFIAPLALELMKPFVRRSSKMRRS